MKKSLKNVLCLLMCAVIVCSSVSVVAAAGDDAFYPDGVTEQQVLSAQAGTDKLLQNAVPLLTGGSLSQLVKPMLYNSDTLSAVVVGLYASMEARGDELDGIGVDFSVSAVASALSDYPEVKNALSKYNSWSEVNLDGVQWGVTDKNGFATALGVAFSPLNDVLYMLMCSGTYEISRFIKISGGAGYTNAVVPMLKSLNCPDILTSEQFTAAANTDKSNIIKNILLPLLGWLEQALVTPSDTLTQSLPSFAYFVQSGEIDKCMQALTEPITSNKLVEIASWLNLIDLDTFNVDIKDIFTTMLADTGENGLKVADLDFETLSKCGTYNGGVFTADKGKAYVVILRWLIDTLKLNSSDFFAILGDEKSLSGDMTDFLNGIFSKDTDVLLRTVILLFSPTEPGTASAMVYPAVTSTKVDYTPNLTEKDYKKVLNEIDDLLDQFVEESGNYNSIEELLKASIYTNDNINTLITEVYSALEKEGMTDILKLLGVDISPKGVAAKLTQNDYKKAAKVLSGADSWSKVSLKGVKWGFTDGSRRGFQNAFTAALRPLIPLFGFLLAGEDIVIMDSITLKGSDGYNSAVIPLLEALGCKSGSIKTYSTYRKNAQSDNVVKYIAEPIFDLIDDICEKPVYTLTEILPNIVYFMNSGSLEKCMSNLMLPLTAVADKFSDVYDFSIDMSSLTKDLDINALLKSAVGSSGVNIAEFDVSKLAGLGTAEQRTSKSTVNGEKTKYTYLKADQTGVLMCVLRVLARTIKMPGNENLIMGAMGDGNSTFSTYSSSISSQFASMTEDEIIEWLYNLLFKERVHVEIVTGEDYKPTIIYKPAEKNYTPLYFAGAYLFVAVVVGAIIFFNRKRLYS